MSSTYFCLFLKSVFLLIVDSKAPSMVLEHMQGRDSAPAPSHNHLGYHVPCSMEAKNLGFTGVQTGIQTLAFSLASYFVGKVI